MKIENSNISGVPVKVLYVENPEIYTEIENKNKQKKTDICYLPSRRLVFGLDFAVDFFRKNKDTLFELQDYYYYGQIGPHKGIILAEL